MTRTYRDHAYTNGATLPVVDNVIVAPPASGKTTTIRAFQQLTGQRKWTVRSRDYVGLIDGDEVIESTCGWPDKWEQPELQIIWRRIVIAARSHPNAIVMFSTLPSECHELPAVVVLPDVDELVQRAAVRGLPLIDDAENIRVCHAYLHAWSHLHPTVPGTETVNRALLHVITSTPRFSEHDHLVRLRDALFSQRAAVRTRQ